MNIISLIFLSIFMKNVYCRDFYIGMFRHNDFLVAQDTLYKGKSAYTYALAKYGRLFKCPITYFRIVDRLGMGHGPTVKIVRGGLNQKYIVVLLKSSYNMPISVNIYVGCENKQKAPRWKRPSKPSKKPKSGDDGKNGKGSGSTPKASSTPISAITPAANGSSTPTTTTGSGIPNAAGGSNAPPPGPLSPDSPPESPPDGPPGGPLDSPPGGPADSPPDGLPGSPPDSPPDSPPVSTPTGV